MKIILFTWDPRKNTANIQKHGISFEEAKSVFYDENARLIHDPDHSGDEERFIILGLSEMLNILVVCHCYREENEIIIISARKATKNEQKQYQEF